MSLLLVSRSQLEQRSCLQNYSTLKKNKELCSKAEFNIHDTNGYIVAKFIILNYDWDYNMCLVWNLPGLSFLQPLRFSEQKLLLDNFNDSKQILQSYLTAAESWPLHGSLDSWRNLRTIEACFPKKSTAHTLQNTWKYMYIKHEHLSTCSRGCQRYVARWAR